MFADAFRVTLLKAIGLFESLDIRFFRPPVAPC